MSTICSSTNWKDIIRVIAYPDSQVSWNFPMNVEKVTLVPSTDFTLSGEPLSLDDTSIGSFVKSSTPIILSINDMDATLKDESKVSVSGAAHTVKLEYTMLCDGNQLPSYQAELTALEAPHTNYHLLVEYLGGNRHLVRSTRDGYQFSWQVADSGSTSCTITINNVSGPQKIDGQ